MREQLRVTVGLHGSSVQFILMLMVEKCFPPSVHIMALLYELYLQVPASDTVGLARHYLTASLHL